MFPFNPEIPPTEPEEEPDDSAEGPVVLPIEDYIDLHTFQPKEVRELLEDYLGAAAEEGFREVRIIHGKGAGILREKVHAILRKHNLVSSFREADASRGGWGATIVVLKSGRVSVDGKATTNEGPRGNRG